MDDTRTIYCGNLANDVTEELLYELFLQAGPVDRVNIPKDKQGCKRNFGFIVFKHEVTVPYAIQLMSGEKLFGKVLRLQARSNTCNVGYEATPANANYSGSRLQKTQSCPSGYPNTHRNNYRQDNSRHGSRSSNGEYHNQQVPQPSPPCNGYNGPIFANNSMPPPNFAYNTFDQPLALRPEPNFILQSPNPYQYQQNWPVRGNRWMRN